MRYLGGKSKIAKQLVEQFDGYLEQCDGFIDLCCGSAKVIEMFVRKYGDAPRCAGYSYDAYDINEYLIALLSSVAGNAFEYPESFSLTRDDYKRILSDDHVDDDKALSGFVGFGLSFGGKWKGGPVPLEAERDYIGETARTLQKQAPYLARVSFHCGSYADVEANGKLIYADPPYADTTKYRIATDFDHEAFWQKMRELSRDNIVLVSEYTAPDDFECVWEKEIRTDLRTGDKAASQRIERLFRYAG